MKIRRKGFLFAVALIALAAISAPQGAIAAGTNACTSITNTATVDYQVGGVGQAQLSSGPSGTFVVGNKVIVTVEKSDAAAITVIASSTTSSLVAANKVLTYTVTNTGNALQDYTLAATTPNGTADPFGGNSDSFDVSGVTVYVETNGTAGYQAGDNATSIDNLDPTVLYSGETVTGSRTVYIVPSGSDPAIPGTAANNDTAVYILTATSYKTDGTTLEANSASATISAIGGGSCSAAVQFAEGTHATNASGELANDGKDTARDTYKVATAVISVSKSSAVYSDPINGTTSPKAIPGAVIRYTISVANAAGGASATLTSIGDVLANSLKIVSSAAGASWSVSGSSRGTASGTLTAETGDTGADGLGHSNAAAAGGTLTATLTTILAAGGSYTAGELKAGETVNIVFDVTIQ